MLKTHVKKGDLVRVISGNHKGATGRVLRVIRKKQQLLVEGVRMITKHEKRSAAQPQGSRKSVEGPIHLSNVKRLESHASHEPIPKNP